MLQAPDMRLKLALVRHSLLCGQVRSLRKRIVKKALGFMEDIDDIKSSMLHSILVPVHANDDQSESDEPVSEAISGASEAAEEDAERTDVKHESEGGVPAVTAKPVSGAAEKTAKAAEDEAKQVDIAGESEGGMSAVTAEPVSGAAGTTANAAEHNAKHSDISHESEAGMPPAAVEPVDGGVSQASEAAEADAEKTDIKHASEDGVPAAESTHDEQTQQVADALATPKVAEKEAAQASAAKQQPGEQEGVNGGNDGEVHGNHGAGIDEEGVENHASLKDDC